MYAVSPYGPHLQNASCGWKQNNDNKQYTNIMFIKVSAHGHM